MSEVYNPETKVLEKLQTLELEARQLAQKRDHAPTDEDRAVLQRQLDELEQRIAVLRRKLKP